ncbi:MAG: tRNA pseudouridine(38-40) synthase TruA [Actinobacteria bacterium]|nr:tRNA pseudouridine(38-40) synthase TruA [Actinomycetota bacterium]
MPNYKLIVEYDGNNYSGFQRQPGLRTIEDEIVGNLIRILQEEVKIAYAGRTDAGVSATNQVISFKTQQLLEERRFRWSLNSILPEDIVVKSVQEVPLEFHARRSARYREYTYYILNRGYPSAFGRRYLFETRKLDIEAMICGANYLVGRHDFRSFCKPSSSVRNTIRELVSVTCKREFDFVVLVFKANSFLHQMVRMMIGAILKVGLGKAVPEDVRDLLSIKRSTVLCSPVEPQGLFLTGVEY